jgi:hypothetical protein
MIGDRIVDQFGSTHSTIDRHGIVRDALGCDTGLRRW